MSTVRTQVYLTAQQKSALDERARLEHRRMAELIREALDRYLGDRPDPTETLESTFGALPKLAVPGRLEWDRG